MKYLVCFLEETSAKEMLKGILPRLLPDDIEPRYIVFEGKSHSFNVLLSGIKNALNIV